MKVRCATTTTTTMDFSVDGSDTANEWEGTAGNEPPMAQLTNFANNVLTKRHSGVLCDDVNVVCLSHMFFRLVAAQSPLQPMPAACRSHPFQLHFHTMQNKDNGCCDLVTTAMKWRMQFAAVLKSIEVVPKAVSSHTAMITSSVTSFHWLQNISLSPPDV